MCQLVNNLFRKKKQSALSTCFARKENVLLQNAEITIPKSKENDQALVTRCNDMIRTDSPDKPGEQGFIVFSRKGNPKSVLTLK